jgi:short subunit dehydrogenase-like uncharacterized protein
MGRRRTRPGPSTVVPAFHGFLTPATALGLDELDRFAEAGLTFQVQSW